MPLHQTPRTRMFAYSVAIGVGLYVLGSSTGRSVGPSYPPLELPVVFPALMTDRINNLHLRYSEIRTTRGVQAVRQQIIADLHGYRDFDAWIESIQNWIRFAGWSDAADLLIDSAEIGGQNVRRNAARILADNTTALPIQNGYASRIVRLHKAETDPDASAAWRTFRENIGI